MSIQLHNLGFPRIGARRELKFALEQYWRGEINGDALETVAAQLRAEHWRWQDQAGLDWLPVGDFSLYDHVLDTSVMLGAIPDRFGQDSDALTTYFRMARGRGADNQAFAALEMTKWFDTNYHFLVPELEAGQTFKLNPGRLLAQLAECKALNLTAQPKPVLLGPLTWLWLAKARSNVDKLALLDALLTEYAALLQILSAQGVEWVQIDEPVLVLDLPTDWKTALEMSYHRLQSRELKLMLTTYFDDLGDNTQLACRLPVQGLHIDLARAPKQLDRVLDNLPAYKTLSLGLIDGRGVWRADLNDKRALIDQARSRFSGALWLAPSCSLLHVPIDVAPETAIEPELKNWLAFARQKLLELNHLQAIATGAETAAPLLAESQAAVAARLQSPRARKADVRRRLAALDSLPRQRQTPFKFRQSLQQQQLALPQFPTTTIGSFPQTTAIRQLRRDYKQGRIDPTDYQAAIEQAIADCIAEQEALGLDVLVHGEFERNDMVEYFAEHLDGFLLTQNGWVQSYGSRCVKPPILYGDVSRPEPITVAWTRYAQSLTEKPVKGMLTGPVTVLNWSFVRDDQPRRETALQLALALSDEVKDLEQAGINIIQIDEAALREGLPLKHRDRAEYLDWAIAAFRLTASMVADSTQIHSHMCYSEFNDIIQAIADMDADVISIEASRSGMALLQAFVDFNYPNAIGPGIYDIHSPNQPSATEMTGLLQQARTVLDDSQIWVNPDCGLKTRGWEEVRGALAAMVEAAKTARR
ncbi:MAG: 5-methyltetrahydropteroyltriglutamate--homocysteine S-methyltransferase [Methylococcales bacterium]|nr:5-methyltetrahydropteroyltriglutamate--homocysteine S-methyltransferase [Methylococcales bacterium]